MARKYINRTIISFASIKLESSMEIAQLSLNKKEGFETYTYQGYSPMITFSINTNNGSFRDRFIKISERTFGRFLTILNKAVEWFYNADMQDMFGVTEDGDLVFNHKYDKLFEVYYDTFNQNCFLKIMPTAIQNKNGKMIEGINIYINNIDTITSLSRYDLEDLTECMKKFSFQSEAVVLMTAYQCAMEANGGAITSSFYLKQQKMDKSLRAVPLEVNYERPKNIFGL